MVATAHCGTGRQQVVEPDTGRELPERDPVAPVDREDEGQRTDEVRRDIQQDAPLAQRLEDEGQVALLQVAEAAVDQPAGA